MCGKSVAKDGDLMNGRDKDKWWKTAAVILLILVPVAALAAVVVLLNKKSGKDFVVKQ